MPGLHYSKISIIAEKRDSQGKFYPLNFTYCKPNGEIKKYENGYISSSHFRPASINVFFPPEMKPKKFRCCNILEFKGIEIYI